MMKTANLKISRLTDDSAFRAADSFDGGEGPRVNPVTGGKRW